MSSFLDLAERSTQSSSGGDLGLLLGSLALPGAGDVVWLLMEDGSRGGKLSVSSFREIHGPLLPFSLIDFVKSVDPYLILVLCLITPFL